METTNEIDLRTVENGELLSKYLETSLYNRKSVEEYDQILTYNIPNYLGKQRVFKNETSKITRAFYIGNISYYISDVYPYAHVKNETTYSIKLKGDLFYIETDKDEPKKSDYPAPLGNIDLFSIPIMRGSKYDPVTKLTNKDSLTENQKKKELLSIGINPYESLGYFIVKGSERVIISQEKLIKNKFLHTINTQKKTEKNEDKDGFEVKVNIINSRMTYDSHFGSKVLILKDWDIKGCSELIIEFTFMGKMKINASRNFFIPILMLFLAKQCEVEKSGEKICILKDIETLFWFIDQFCDTKHRIFIHAYLHKLYENFEKIKMGYEYRNSSESTATDCVTTTRSRRTLKIEHTGTDGILYNYILNNSASDNPVTKFKKFLNQDLFPITSLKAHMLAIFLVRHIETVLNLREPDDNDSWINKRIETPARMIESLVISLWNKNIDAEVNKNAIENLLLNSREKNTGDLLKTKLESICRDDISKKIESSFSTGNWLGGNAKGGKTVTEIRESAKSILNQYSQSTKITSSVNENERKVSVREVRSDQFGYICPTETAEGGLCGITKHTAITCQFSFDRDPLEIWSSIRDNIPPGETYLMINGMLMAKCNGIEMRDMLINYRRKCRIPYDVSITLEGYDLLRLSNDPVKFDYKILRVQCDGGRPIRPLIICDDTVPRLSMNKSFDDMVRAINGKEVDIEYIDCFEQNYCMVASDSLDIERRKKEYSDFIKTKGPERSLIRLKNRLRITHMELDPITMFGYAASMVPMAQRIPGPRISNQSGYGKQAMSLMIAQNARFDTSSKFLKFATRPLFETQIARELIQIPNGRNLLVCLMTFEGMNQEDAIILNKETNDSMILAHKIEYVRQITIDSEEYVKGIADSHRDIQKKFGYDPYMPLVNRLKKLNNKGFIKVGETIEEDDILVLKYKMQNSRVIDESIYADMDEIGGVVIEREIIDKTGMSKAGSNGSNRSGFIRIEKRKKGINVGDKLAIRYSQKGVCGAIVEKERMPVITSGPYKGKTVDIIINPHSIPSRMTISMFYEMLLGQTFAITGKYVDATTFRDITDIERILVNSGMNKYGKVDMEIGQKGSPNYREQKGVQVGFVYVQSLPHLVESKMQAVARANIDISTQQAKKGRTQGGGLRMGEMEVWAACSHGAVNVVTERTMLSSDKANMTVCECNYPAVYDDVTNSFKCSRTECQNKKVYKMTIPYSYVRYMNVFLAAGVQITNVPMSYDSITSPDYSGFAFNQKSYVGETNEDDFEEEDEEIEEEEDTEEYIDEDNL